MPYTQHEQQLWQAAACCSLNAVLTSWLMAGVFLQAWHVCKHFIELPVHNPARAVSLADVETCTETAQWTRSMLVLSVTRSVFPRGPTRGCTQSPRIAP